MMHLFNFLFMYRVAALLLVKLKMRNLDTVCWLCCRIPMTFWHHTMQ